MNTDRHRSLHIVRVRAVPTALILALLVTLLAPQIGRPATATTQRPVEPSAPGQANRALAAGGNSLAALAAAGSLLACGDYGDTDWTTTSGSFEVVRQCTLSIPQAGWVYLAANGSLGNQDGEYEAQFHIGIDDTIGDWDIDRWVNVYDDAGDGSDIPLALSVLQPITAGSHAFYFLGRRFTGSGTVFVYDPSFSVIFIPAADTDVQVCGAYGNLSWTTTSSSFEIIRECTLSTPQAGWIFVSADASLGNQNGEYEGQFGVGIDDTYADGDMDRWVNVYDDAGDGSDMPVALSVLQPITAGSHTFYFLGRRYGAGTGTVLAYDPTLSVIYVPAASTAAVSCSDYGNLNWTTTSSSFEIIRECSLSIPYDGWVFLSADGSMANEDGEYEAQFSVGIDDPSGDHDIDRWVNVYDDAGDGSDRSVALSVLQPITAGNHTFYFLGSRYAGPGTVLVFDPTLSVIAIEGSASGLRVFLPVIYKDF